jgi:hypothetical protein
MNKADQPFCMNSPMAWVKTEHKVKSSFHGGSNDTIGGMSDFGGWRYIAVLEWCSFGVPMRFRGLRSGRVGCLWMRLFMTVPMTPLAAGDIVVLVPSVSAAMFECDINF